MGHLTKFMRVFGMVDLYNGKIGNKISNKSKSGGSKTELLQDLATLGINLSEQQKVENSPSVSSRRYNTPQELRITAQEYFDKVKAMGEPPTMAGLVLHLGFAHREALTRYSLSYGPEYAFVVKWMKTYIEDYLATTLSKPRTMNTQGPIFLLKCTHAYRESSDIIPEPLEGELNSAKSKLLSGIQTNG